MIGGLAYGHLPEYSLCGFLKGHWALSTLLREASVSPSGVGSD